MYNQENLNAINKFFEGTACCPPRLTGSGHDLVSGQFFSFRIEATYCKRHTLPIIRLINESDDSGRGRKAYSLTQVGKGILEAETARMQSLVAMTQKRSSEGSAS